MSKLNELWMFLTGFMWASTLWTTGTAIQFGTADHIPAISFIGTVWCVLFYIVDFKEVNL